MALIKCKDCGNDVSTDAKSCPKCGANIVLPKAAKKPTSPILKIFLGLIVFGAVVNMAINGNNKREAEKADQALLAAMPEEQRDKVLAERERQKKANEEKAAQDAAKKTEAEAVLEDISLAEITCQMSAKERANDPSSIEWIRSDRKFAFTSKDSKKALSLQPMRAKNAMGAIILTSVKCDLEKVGKDWQVIKMVELH